MVNSNKVLPDVGGLVSVMVTTKLSGNVKR